jgi:hypothetical protein
LHVTSQTIDRPVRFEVFTTMTMKWSMKPCNLVDGYVSEDRAAAISRVEDDL